MGVRNLGHEVPGFIQDDFVAVVEEVYGFVAHDEVWSFGLLEQEGDSGLVALGRSLFLLVWVEEFVRSLLILTLTAILFDLWKIRMENFKGQNQLSRIAVTLKNEDECSL